MPIKLHRCGGVWVKLDGHPCWKVQKALDEQGIDYEVVKGPLAKRKRSELQAHTGQQKYPAIEFEDGSWYRDESKEMAATIRAGLLDSKRAQATAS